MGLQGRPGWRAHLSSLDAKSLAEVQWPRMTGDSLKQELVPMNVLLKEPQRLKDL